MENPFSFLSGRDDIYFKFPLARAFLSGRSSDFATAAYLEHLYRWNRFYEDAPRKNGPEEFLESFRELCSSMGSLGLSGDFEPPLVNGEGKLVSGSHRMALHLVGSQLAGKNMPARFSCLEYPSRDFSFSFFAEKGLAPHVLRHAVLEKMGHFIEPHLPVLIVWPRARPWLNEIASMIEIEFPSVRIRQDTALSVRGLENLVLLSYGDEDWAQEPLGVLNKTSEVREQGSLQHVSVFVLEPTTVEKMRELKTRIRAMWGNDFQGIHSTDSSQESLVVFSSLAFPESVAVIETVKTSKLRTVRNRLSSVREELRGKPGAAMATAVSGSQWLHLLGLRKAGDVDLLVIEKLEYKLFEANHNSYLRGFGLDPLEIISEPHLHWWVLGMKFIAPSVYLKIMTERAEPKDRGFINSFTAQLVHLEAAARTQQVELTHTNQDIRIGVSGPSPWSSSLSAELGQQSQLALAGEGHSRLRAAIRPKIAMLWWRTIAVIMRLPSRLPPPAKKVLGGLKRRFLAIFKRSR